MDELKFVIKCFIFAMSIVTLSQVKMGSETLEAKAEFFLQKSETAFFLQESAKGGALILEQGFNDISNYIKNKWNQNSSENQNYSRN